MKLDFVFGVFGCDIWDDFVYIEVFVCLEVILKMSGKCGFENEMELFVKSI